MNVLVVDDSTILGQILAELLTGEGCTVRTQDRDFADLLEPSCAAWAEVDAVICDLFLNDIVSGVDVLAVAKHDHPNVLRIAWSGAGSPLIAEAEPVADLVVVKPGVQDVLDAVRGHRG